MPRTVQLHDVKFGDKIEILDDWVEELERGQAGVEGWSLVFCAAAVLGGI